MTDDLKARVSYLRGFAEGLELGEESKEEKVLQRIIGLLEDMTDEIEQLSIENEELFEYTEAIDDDLTELEDDFYEEEDEEEEDEYFDDELAGGFAGGFSMECPNCREIVVVDEDILDHDDSIEVTCPGCGEVVLVDDEEWDMDIEESPDELDKEE
ncbi:MAG: CD1247 N-terminal domain-containing protein [Bacillota bacterium]